MLSTVLLMSKNILSIYILKTYILIVVHYGSSIYNTRLYKWTHLCKQYPNHEIEHYQKSPWALSQSLHPNGNYFPFFLNHRLVLHVFTFHVIEVLHNVLFCVISLAQHCVYKINSYTCLQYWPLLMYSSFSFISFSNLNIFIFNFLSN